MAEPKTTKIKVVRTKSCPAPDKETTALLIKFLTYCAKELKLSGTDITIRLLGKSPKEPITTGAYNPENKTCSTIVEGRHFVDWCRTLAHELTHMQQDIKGKLKTVHPEIGGDIEDEANMMSGRFVKHFIKNILTTVDKTRLGLGTYGEEKPKEKDKLNEQIDLLLELYGGEIVLKTSKGDKHAVISKNTKVGEKPFRITFEFPELESGWSHIPLDRVDADLLLNHIVPDRIRNELPFCVYSIKNPSPSAGQDSLDIPLEPASDERYASLGQLASAGE